MMVDRTFFSLVLALLLAGASTATAQDDWYEGDDDQEESSDPDAEGAGDEGADDDAEAGAADDFSDSGDAGDPGDPGNKFPLRLLATFKGGGGGNYLGSPSNPPAGAPFNDGTGGWGAMMGVTVQATVFEGLLGLELGLLRDWGYSWSELTLNNIDTEWGYEFSTWRFPLLLEVGTPGEGSRLAFATGPEFGFGGDATIMADVKSAGIGDPPDQPATGQAATFWVFNLGAEMSVREYLVVTFDVHYAMNLDVKDDFFDRLDSNGLHEAKNAHEMRLLLGIGYAHDFLL